MFSYPNCTQKAIAGISAVINKGEKIAIVGENGSGKTTFVKLLMGLYPVSSGELRVDNINIADINKETWLQSISVVMQNSFHLPIEVSQDVSFDNSVEDQLLIDALSFSGIYDKITSLPYGWHTIISSQFSDKGIDLSGGEKQKLALARAFYKQANFLILDEPSSALDPNAEYELFEKINQLQKDKTVIYISHRLSTTVNADRILVFQEGRIVEFGNHRQLMNQKGVYFDMFTKQANYYIEEVE